jgi:parallel beta-helix repeat protein
MRKGLLMRYAVVAAAAGIATAAVPITSSQAVACSGVKVSPGTSIQSKINGHPVGTSFCLQKGTHRLSRSLYPKRGQKFIGVGGTILDGGGGPGGHGAFKPNASDVVVRRLEIRNFATAVRTGRDWLVENSNIHDNTEGVRLLHGSVARNNFIHHQILGGVHAYGSNILIEGNHISYNQRQTHRCTQKFILTRHLVVRGNYLHNNTCPVLWADLNSYHPVFYNNTVVNNNGPGIDCEISYKCIIHHNIVKNNPRGILVSSSPDVEVYANTVQYNHDVDINIVQQGDSNGIRKDHPSSYGPHLTKNNYVHHNNVTMRTGLTGVTKYGNVGTYVYSAKANNRFEANNYRVPFRSGRYFRWADSPRTWLQWRAFGKDNPIGSLQIL